MKNRKFNFAAACLILALSLVCSLALSAQTGGAFEIKQSVISNGGGASSGGAFGVVSTIGEPLAGNVSTGANFSIAGGFWGGGQASII